MVMEVWYIFLFNFFLKFSSGLLGNIFPPPLQIGLEAIPTRARPVPFCLHGFRVDFATSDRPFCALVAPLAFDRYEVTT